MTLRKLFALLLCTSMIGSYAGVVPVAADDNFDYFVEAESTDSTNWMSVTGGIIQNNTKYSNGKYLNLVYPSGEEKEWYAEYSVDIDSAGLYAIDIASTPIGGGWSSPIKVSVNGDSAIDLRGSQYKTIPNDWSIAWYHANVVYLNKGMNTIRFFVTKSRSDDGNVLCYFDCFALTKTNFGIYAIKSDAPMQAFEESDDIKFTAEATGKAAQTQEAVYEVLDYQGKMVEAGRTSFEKGSDKAEIKLAPKKKGAYQLCLSLGDQSMIKQFIVVTDMEDRKEVKDSPFAIDALPYGMANDINSSLSEDYSDLIALSGVKWVRDRVYFDPYVSKNGSQWSFTMPYTAKTSSLLAKRGVNVSMAMDWMPATLRTGCYGKVIPTNLFDVYDFWKQLSEKYDGQVNCWEIGNEYDLGGAASNLDGADTYASMFKAAALGIIDSETENEVYVSPFGCAGSALHSGQFSSLMYENEIYNYTDIVNFHDHTGAVKEYKNYYNGARKIEEHRGLQEKYNASVINWDGESGISLDIPSTSDYTAEQQMVQAKFLVTSFVEDISKGTDKKFFFDGINFQEGGKAWGMTSRGKVSPSAYAAWATLSGMTYVLGEGNYVNKIKNVPEDIAAYLFTDGDDSIIVFYSTREDYEKVPVSFNVGYNEATVYDIFANGSQVFSDNGVYSFVVDGEPTYLKVKGKITTDIVSDETVREQKKLPDTQKNVSDADRVVLLQQYEDLQRNGARLSGYQLSKDVNKVKVAVYNFNDHDVSGKIVGKSANGWEIKPLTQDISLKSHEMKEVEFEIMPDGFKGQEDRITFYADLDCGKSADSTIWANSKKVIDALPLIKDGVTNIRMKLENRLDVEKTVEKIELTVDGNTIEENNAVTIAPKSTRDIDIPVEIAADSKDLDIKAKVYFEGGETFDYSKNIPFTVAKEKIDLSSEPNFVLPDDGTVVSNMYYGEDDLYAKVWLAADDDNFYMTIQAKDNLHSGTSDDASSIWNDDGIQFALAQGLPDSGSKYYELGMSLNQKLGSIVYCWNDGLGGGKAGVFKDAECKITRDNVTYITTYELKLPWSSISPISRDDNMMSFSMLINDNDGMGRTGYLEWGSGIGSTKDPGKYRTVLFMK